MPSIGQHVIRRQVLNVEVFGTEAHGLALQRRLPELCYSWLTPALEPVLERSVPSGEHLTIDRLEIDAGTFGLENLERDLVAAVTQALEKLLRERVLAAGAASFSGAVERRTEAQSVWQSFLHFLRTGSLPWWFHLPAGETLEDAVLDSWRAAGPTGALPEDARRGMIEALESSFVRQRLSRQFSADFLTALIAELSGEAAAAMAEVFAGLETHGFAGDALRRFAERSWETAFAMLAAGRRPAASALIAEYLRALSEPERQNLVVLVRLRQLSEAPSPDQAPDVDALIAAFLNSLPDAERQTLALVERLTRLWPEAPPPAREPEDSAQIAAFVNALPATEPQKSALIERMTRLRRETPSSGEPDEDTPRDGARAGSTSLARDGSPEKGQARDKDRAPGEEARARDPDRAGRDSAGRMPTRTSGAERDEPPARIDLAEGVYVGCAGVVLLHPFLPRLFTGLGIATDDKLVQPDRALGLLHFLATGQRHAPEYELVLPKLLCDLSLEAPVEAPSELTAAEEEEAAALLAAVIRHWDALGDTSADGLRGTFLVRPGKLSQRADGDHLLQVEARSFDILLDLLPWGIGTIRLPWMKRILWVEWRL